MRSRKINFCLGVSLIEVLIALAVITFGLTGAVVLQTNALKNVAVTENRAQASLLGNSMLERIRANKINANEYQNPVGNLNRISSIDLREWRQALRENLPSGTGSVRVNGEEVSITINWVERSLFTNADQTATSFSINTTL